jgi:hypothetical protein
LRAVSDDLVAGRRFDPRQVSNRMLLRWWTTGPAPTADARFVYLGRLGPDAPVEPGGWFVSRTGRPDALAFGSEAEARAAAEALIADGDTWYAFEAYPLARSSGTPSGARSGARA